MEFSDPWQASDPWGIYTGGSAQNSLRSSNNSGKGSGKGKGKGKGKNNDNNNRKGKGKGTDTFTPSGSGDNHSTLQDPLAKSFSLSDTQDSNAQKPKGGAAAKNTPKHQVFFSGEVAYAVIKKMGGGFIGLADEDLGGDDEFPEKNFTREHDKTTDGEPIRWIPKGELKEYRKN